MKQFFLILAVGMFCCTSALAKPAGFDGAVQLYNKGQYRQALAQFQQIAKTSNDTSTHYYMGLCYQCLNQTALAKAEYNWVAARDRNLSGYCQQALRQIDSRKSKTYQAEPINTARLSVRPNVVGRLKVIEFYTEWCGVCTRFKPSWDEVSSKMGSKVDFRSLDAEDSANENLAKQYGIKAYPTIIYTDGSGRVLEHHRGGYRDADSFATAVNFYLQ